MGKPAAQCSGPAPHAGWLHAVLQSSFPCFFSSLGQVFFQAPNPTAVPEALVLLQAQLWYRLQVWGEGREQPESGTICSLVFWQPARCRVDLGWLPVHTSCNTICGVTKSQIILSKGGPVPRAPPRSPAVSARVTASAS